MDIRKVVLATPLNWVRKLKDSHPFAKLKGGKHDFALGIIFGAIFSLLVNVITVQLTEKVQSQRVQEALENEILTNYLTAQRVITNDKQLMDEDQMPNFYRVSERYSNDVYIHSNILNYSIELDPKIQAQILSFYNAGIPNTNRILDKNDTLINNKLNDCYPSTTPFKPSQINDCKIWNKIILNGEMGEAQLISNYAYALLKVYHPTKDRLASPLLKFLMGTKGVGALALPNSFQ